MAGPPDANASIGACGGDGCPNDPCPLFRPVWRDPVVPGSIMGVSAPIWPFASVPRPENWRDRAVFGGIHPCFGAIHPETGAITPLFGAIPAPLGRRSPDTATGIAPKTGPIAPKNHACAPFHPPIAPKTARSRHSQALPGSIIGPDRPYSRIPESIAPFDPKQIPSHPTTRPAARKARHRPSSYPETGIAPSGGA